MRHIAYIFFIAVFLLANAGLQNVHADDDFDWSDLKAKYEYDSRDEDLEITIYLDNIDSRPSDDYEIEVEINNRDYDKTMSYSSSRDELYADFNFRNIDENDYEDYLDLDITIRDEDGVRVFDDVIEMRSSGNTNNNSDNLDWDDTEFSYSYSESRERLTIKVELEDVTRTPRYTYTVDIEADRRDYDARMVYSSSGDRLYANVVISNVDEDDLENYLDIDVQIRDNRNVKVYDEEIDLEDERSNNNSLSSRLDWSELEASVVYEKDKNRLRVRLELDNVDRNEGANASDYDVILKVDGKRYNLNMFYSQTNRTLYTNKYINVFSESRVNNSYNLDIVIEDEDNDEVYDRTRRVTTNKNGSSTSIPENNSVNNNTVFTNSQIEVQAYRYIYRVEARYSSRTARTAYLNRTIQVLQSNRYSISNKALVDGMIRVMRERIASYDTGSSIGGTTTNRVPVTTPKKPNKAATMKPDGNGGTFKYVGGYNY